MGFTVLGIDQSLVNMGICLEIVQDDKPLTTILQSIKPKKIKGVERLNYIDNSIIDIIQEYYPGLMVMEGYSYESKNQAHKIGELGGILKLQFYINSSEIIVVPPKTLKKFITGNGNASKQDMCDHYGIKDHNQADAKGLAEFGLYYMGYREPQNRYQMEALKLVKENPENLEKRKKDPTSSRKRKAKRGLLPQSRSLRQPTKV